MEGHRSITRHTSRDLIAARNDVEEKHVPKELYTVGDVSLLTTGRRVSVVGTRKPSEEGIRRVRVVVHELVRNDITVVSGLADGIDAIAHKTAIDRGGKTIAVLGGPLDNPHPAKNRALFAEIAKNHLAISQFPSGYPIKPENFPIRNRLMALVTDATIIIEAGKTSGTRHQGWEALRLGRQVFLLENVVNDAKLSWAREMLQYGAEVLRRDEMSSLIQDLPNYTSREEFVF